MTKYRLVRDVAPFKRGDEFTLTHEHGITAYAPVGTRDVSVLLPPYLLDELNDTAEAIAAIAQEACKPAGSDVNSPKWTPLLDNLRKYEQDEIMDTLFEDIDVDEVIYYIEASCRPIDCLIVCRDKAGDWYCRSIELEEGSGLGYNYDDRGLTKFSVIGIYGLMKLHDWTSVSMMAAHLKTEGYLAEYLE